MAVLRQFDHVGITVTDLDAAVAFFTRLGLEVEGRTPLEGPFLDAVVGITGARTEIVVLRPPGGGTGVELATFQRPEPGPGTPDALANEVGLRSIAFEVTGLYGLVAELARDGHPLVGTVGEHEGTWRMGTVRGPDGVLVSLAERVV